MRDIKTVIEEILSKEDFRDRIEETKALLFWNDVVGRLSQKTKPVKITDGKLLVNTANSVILHVLTLNKRRYIEKINLLMGKPVVKEIVFRIGNVDDLEENRICDKEVNYAKRLDSIQLEKEVLVRIDEITSEVQDLELRNSLREIFIKQSKLDRLRSDESIDFGLDREKVED